MCVYRIFEKRDIIETMMTKTKQNWRLKMKQEMRDNLDFITLNTNIDDLDLEDDDVVRQLIAECQGRGISPSSIKHLRSLLRFLNKQKEFAKKIRISSFRFP